MQYWKQLEGPPYQREQNRIIQDSTQYVRNSALICSLVKCREFMSESDFQIVQKHITEYCKLRKENILLWRQATIFLAVATKNYSLFSYLWKNIDKMDNLEKAETIWALSHEFSGYADKVQIPEIDINDIFTWNWLAQAYSLKKKKTIPKLPLLHDLSKKETNELAVLFEGFSALLRIFPTNHQLIQGQFATWVQLERRLQDSLYAFKNGSCRIDITVHVINGTILINNWFK